MSFAQDTGYTPKTFDELMDELRQGINGEFSTNFTPETFVGTNWYKYWYQLVQKSVENETKTAEIFQKLQEYIATTNDRIQRPSVSSPGVIDSFYDNGFVASVKPPQEIDAGKIFICVDTNSDDPDYPATKLHICNLIKDYVAAGIISQGDQVESIVLDNGQSFDFKFYLPTYIPILLKLTATSSENSSLIIPSDEVIRQNIFDNINDRYRLGLNFEPQRYFEILDDAPWAATILLEWSIDAGENWSDAVFNANFDQLFTFNLGDIAISVDP